MSHCTECSDVMSRQEAALYEECPKCRHKGVAGHKVSRFAATGRNRLKERKWNPPLFPLAEVAEQMRSE